jgi:hypothetical protein
MLNIKSNSMHCYMKMMCFEGESVMAGSMGEETSRCMGPLSDWAEFRVLEREKWLRKPL